MRIACIGGGPAGLYFSILWKKRHPADVVHVFERNPPGVTFGWGVVFSDETLSYLADNDRASHDAITRGFCHWDAIDVHVHGERIRSVGHGFCGIARRELLRILHERATELGVVMQFERGVDDIEALRSQYDLVVAADGVRSAVRERYARTFGPSLDLRACKYVWLGTDKRFDAFQFIVLDGPGTLPNGRPPRFQAHAYPFDASTSTFIVECDEASWCSEGFDTADEATTLHKVHALFAEHLRGHKLFANKSTWLNFPTVRNASWCHENVVLLGDAAHTAHFSIGSGTKLAMEDAIALAAALDAHGVRDGSGIPAALRSYEARRRPVVGRVQKAAQDSLVFFENIGRYGRQDALSFAVNLLTRSKRIGYANLRVRDEALVERAREAFMARAHAQAFGAGQSFDGGEARKVGAAEAAAPPMFTPFRLRTMVVRNRVVVSPMCMYSAINGAPGDFHLVHLGARALGGAGLIVTEMTNVAADARITPGCTGMYEPSHVAAWRRITDFVHAQSQAKICLQLGHAGRKGATKLMWEGMDEPLEHGAWPLIAPSPISYLPHGQVPRPMTRSDMDRVTAEYVRATRMAVDAGFDMIELHCAHGYLLASFLSPLTNVRTDEYGGSLENRLRYPLEVFAAVREAWPAHLPMSVRISAADWALGGLMPSDAVEVAKAFKAAGADIIDVSSGQTVAEAQPAYGRMWQTPFSDRIRHEVQIPTMAVGGISSADQVNTILLAERADLCAIARPHLADPQFTLHAAEECGFSAAPWPLPYRAGAPLVPQA